MHSVLKRNLFFIKEHVGIFKAANNFDVFDPQSNELILNCREDNLGFFTKMLRFSDYKRMTPFCLEVKTPTGEKVLTVKRGVSIFLSTVDVLDENDMLVGRFKQKFFSIGGKFNVLNPQDEVISQLKGKWTSWEFKFVNNDVEYAMVSKKWAGMGKELFTSADNYMLEIYNATGPNDPMRIMILAAVLSIDMVLKE
ncbi:phospholipid scramblase-related protein [soil metagenome]